MIALAALVCQALSAADTAYPKACERWCPLARGDHRLGQVARFDITVGDHHDDRLERLAR
jgi:hypothetical protein